MAVDINTIPYDAPLSISEPSKNWLRKKLHKGQLSTTFHLPTVDLKDKWVVISGSNNGIGREAALQFAAWGANLILACRDPPAKELHPSDVVTECLVKARAKGYKDSIIEWWEIDMTDLATVEAFAQRWLKTGRPLDILCNNAGVGSSPGGSSKVFKTKDGFEFIHQINLLSHVLLTLTLLPSIAAAKAPRIVCTTSCFHYPGVYDLTNFNGEKGKGMGQNGVQFYMNNKLFFQIWLTELQLRLEQHEQYKHIVVQGVHPGYVNTGVWNLNTREPLKEPFLKLLAFFLAITPQQGSLAILNAATSPKAGEVRAQYWNRIEVEEAMPHTKDADARLRVWRKVNDELHLEQKGLLKVLGLRAIGT